MDLRSNEDYKIIDDISSGFNGSATSFALQVGGATPVPFPKFEQQLLISVNGVIQEPDPTGSAGFKLSGTNIVFSSAPTNGHAFFGVIYAGADYVNAGGTFPDGSINFPSITFSADTNTGFTRTASGTVALISDGTKVAQFPTSQGSSGQALITDGGGNLSFGVPTAAFTDITLADSIIHSGDTNTKIKFPAADTVSVETAGTERIRVASNGDIGIGTTTLNRSDAGRPLVQFDYSGSDGSEGIEIRFSNSAINGNASTDNAAITYIGQTLGITNRENGTIQFRNNGSERMRILANGNVGIGTTSPALLGGDGGRVLHLAGTANPEIVLERTTSGTEAKASIRITDTEDLRIAVKDGSASTIDALAIDSTTGHVGIGTNSPDARLQIGDSTVSTANVLKFGKRVSSTNSNLPVIGHHGDGTGSGIAICATSSAGQITFFTGNNAAGFGAGDNTQRMVIDQNGDVAIGTTAPGGNTLKVQLTDDNSDSLVVQGGSGQGRTNIRVQAGNTDGTASTSYRLSDSSGNTVASLFFMNNADDLVIGTQKQGGEILFHTSTASNSLGSIYRAKFDQNGNFHLGGSSNSYSGKARFFSANNGTATLSSINTSNSGTNRQIDFFHASATGRVGSIQTNSSETAFNTSSDYRLKENEVAISDGITRLKKLKPYRFNFKIDPTRTVDGFFAHEVTPAVPEAISGEKDALDSNGDIEPQSIDQSKLVPLLTAALQEAIAKIETLETKVAALEAA